MEESAEFFRDLCENASDLIQSVSPEGRFLYVNHAWLRTLGYASEEVAGLNVFDVIHPDSRAHCEVAMAEVMTGRPATRIEAEFRSKDGRKVPVEGSATCRFEGGRPVSTRGIFRDISARRKVQAELDHLFNLSLDLLCVASVDGYLKEINPAFERVLGYSREELLSRSFIEFVHPDDRASTLAEVERLAQGIAVVDFQNRYRARDGTYRWLAWRSVPVPERGLIYAVARDITRQKRVQEAMALQTEELARSNADLEQFAYAASHDLRAPLRSIVKLAEWIEEELPDVASDKLKGHLAQLKGRVHRMETMTDDLLRYARAGREGGAADWVDTATLVRDLTFLLSPPEGIRVAASGPLPAVRTARSPLEQVFRNLIGNAIKHHDRADGAVAVSARDLGDSYEFAVADDGPGIPADSRQEVFKMFHQLKSRDQMEGSGIGLSLVKRIVEGHGGRVWIDPAEGRGTTFRFTWPKSMAAEAAENGDDPRR